MFVAPFSCFDVLALAVINAAIIDSIERSLETIIRRLVRAHAS